MALKIYFVSIISSYNYFYFLFPEPAATSPFPFLFPEPALTTPYPARLFPNKLAPRAPNNILTNPPFCSFVLL